VPLGFPCLSHGEIAFGFFNIGSVYRLFPFPKGIEEFKQKPYGSGRRAIVEGLIGHWARPTKVSAKIDAGSLHVRIADYRFSRGVFQQLVAYVWQGGCRGGRTTPGRSMW